MTPTDHRQAQWITIGDLCAVHVIALGEAGFIGEEGVQTLIRGVDSVRSAPAPDAVGLLALISEFDQRVDAITPPGFAGAAAIGRGELDLAAAVARIQLRQSLGELSMSAMELIEGLIALAQTHVVSLMPAYVDGQIAQPTTYGHMLGGLIGPLERGLMKLEAAAVSVNRSPLGSASLASTGLSVERERLAELAGFDGLIENTFDAVSATDYLVDTLEAIEALLTPVLRWLEEIQHWIRTEPGSFTVNPASTTILGQLPQGRFPAILTNLTQQILGHLARIAALRAAALATPFGPLTAGLDHLSDGAYTATLGAVSLLGRSAELLVNGLTVNRALLANRAGKGFSTASDLAEFLMIEEQIDPGSARNIAALTISTARDQGLEISGITQELIDGAALMVIGREIKVEFEAISRYLAPRRFIERRTATGAPSPTSTRALLEVQQTRLIDFRARAARRIAALDRASTTRQHLETQALTSAVE